MAGIDTPSMEGTGTSIDGEAVAAVRHSRNDGLGRALAAGLALTVGYAAVEVGAGLWSGSLALVADAGHMVVDSAGLLLALAATAVAARPADLRRTYGYARAEVLAVPAHVALLLGLAGYLAYESADRIGGSPDIEGWPVLAVGTIGLAVNLVTFRLLHGHSEHNLNARGVRLEVLFDALGSVGVVLAAGIIIATGWTAADVVISLAIAALAVPRALALLRQALSILLESTPPGVDAAAIARDARSVPGVHALHDLHVWCLAPSFVALSAHVEVDSLADAERQIAALSSLFRERYQISHVTLQPETAALHAAVACCEFPDAVSAAAERHRHEGR